MAEKVPDLQQPKPPQGNPFRALGEVVLEVGDDKNRCIMFGPSQMRLRGWWKRENLIGISMHETLTQMPNLPGLHIVLDLPNRVLKILDPLSFNENKDLLVQAKKIHKEMFRTDAGPEKEYREEDCSDTKIKSWLFHVRRMLDNKQCRIISGAMPSMDKIVELPGYTMTEMWDSSSRSRKYREEDDKEVAARNQMVQRH